MVRSRSCELPLEVDRLADHDLGLVVHGGDLRNRVAAVGECGDGLGREAGVLDMRFASDLGRHDAKVRSWPQQVGSGQPSAFVAATS